MFLHLEFKMRNKLSLGNKSWILYMLNPDFCMRLFQMLQDPILTPRSSLGHIPMVLLTLQVPNLHTWLRNKWASYQLTSLHRDKLRLRLNLPNRWVYFSCNHRTRKATSILEGIRKKEKIIVKVGTRTKMLIIMTRIIMLGETRSLKERWSFHASCVRMTISLTCALVWKMPRGS